MAWKDLATGIERASRFTARAAEIFPFRLGRQAISRARRGPLRYDHARFDPGGIAPLALVDTVLPAEPVAVLRGLEPVDQVGGAVGSAGIATLLGKRGSEPTVLLDRHFLGGDGQRAFDPAEVPGLVRETVFVVIGRAHPELEWSG